MPILVPVLLLVPILGAALVWLLWRPGWMGLSGKTLWDWIALLAVPAMVGFGTFLLSAAQHQLERERATEAAVQQFIDRISTLALDERASDNPDLMAAVGRAQTLAMLRLVDGERAGRVLAFLAELDLLHRFSVEFEGLDLSGADLKGLSLDGLDFEGCDLSSAELENAALHGADLEQANLAQADLKNADLSSANLEQAWLKGSDLAGTDLRGADLSGAHGLTQRQLAPACLDATTRMPAGLGPVTAQTTGCAGAVED